MRKNFALLGVCLLVAVITQGSFPVKKSKKNNQTENHVITSEKKGFEKTIEELTFEPVKIAKSELKESKKKSSKAPDDMTTLILLWVFLGGFAAHRWYAGKPTGANILYILTFGGCGVWAIIDLIKIIKGEF